MLRHDKKGFSLIELLVVIAIIALLAAIAVPVYNRYLAKVKITSALSLLEDVKQKVNLYYNKNQDWPNSLNDLNLTANEFNSDLIASLGLIGPPNGCFGAPPYAGNVCVYLRLNSTEFPGWTGGLTPTIIMSAFTPSSNDEAIVWNCTTDTESFSVNTHIPSVYLPSGCINPGGS